MMRLLKQRMMKKQMSMNFYISYFGQFRNMTSKQICFSTAVWDPKWFHDFQGQDHKFVKDGKIYGLRMPCFICDDRSCSGQPCQYNPDNCQFLRAYSRHLHELNFNEIFDALTKTADLIAKELNVEEPDIVLLVHETPVNKCSERHALIRWFGENSIELKEWKKENK